MDAGYGEVFCHPETAALLLEPGLTIDGRPAKAKVVGDYWFGMQIRLSYADGWWSQGVQDPPHMIRAACFYKKEEDPQCQTARA